MNKNPVFWNLHFTCTPFIKIITQMQTTTTVSWTVEPAGCQAHWRGTMVGSLRFLHFMVRLEILLREEIHVEW